MSNVYTRCKRILREPMLHFVLIGAGLFVAYGWISPADESSGHRIVVSQGVVDDLVTQFRAVRGREPGPDEARHLIDAYVRDEILYREGLALGLERDDTVVKRRVRQKMEVMEEEEARSTPPTEDDLSKYLATNRTRFVQPPLITFEQVFLGSRPSRVELQHAVALVRDRDGRGVKPAAFAKPTLLPSGMDDAPADVIARRFGDQFAAALEGAAIGEWVGPIETSYGLHIVRVSHRTTAVTPPLSDVRDQVVREWENDRRVRARDDRYAKLRREYDVVIEAGRAGQ